LATIVVARWEGEFDDDKARVLEPRKRCAGIWRQAIWLLLMRLKVTERDGIVARDKDDTKLA